MKTCKTCQTTKEYADFYTSYVYKNKPVYAVECKVCSKKRTLAHQRNNKDQRYNSSIKYLYGITKDDYDRMLQEQNFKCKICGIDYNQKLKKRFDIDHCHNTGKVRGLLCQNCNSGLGKFKDNVDVLTIAAEYLRSNK